MSITDELREYADRLSNSRHPWSGIARDLDGIADRIDAAHQKAEDEWKAKDGQSWLHGYAECRAELMEGNEVIAASLEEAGWVKLPVSDDGNVLYIGDLVDEKLPFGGYAAPAPVDTMELSRGASGYRWMVKLDAENRALINPKLLRHHHAPTVEDVLREFALAVCKDDALTIRKGVVEEYAKRLTLAEGSE